jgi:hypothetical protein
VATQVDASMSKAQRRFQDQVVSGTHGHITLQHSRRGDHNGPRSRPKSRILLRDRRTHILCLRIRPRA